MESCATCSKFLRCDRPEKGSICSKYKPWTDTQLDLLNLFSEKGSIPKHVDISNDMDSYDDKVAEANLQKMLQEALSPNNAIPPDLKFDDRDLKEFPNFYEFCMSPEGIDQPPLAKQLVIYTHLLAEWCPNCTYEPFHDIRDFPTDYNVKNAKDDITFLEYGVCPKCSARRSELIEQGLLHPYNSLALALGQRSGKSIGITMLVSYLIHRFLKLQSPTRAYSLTKNTNLSGTFVGITFKRAVDLLFEPIEAMITESKWFSQYFELLDHYGDLYGNELYKFGAHGLVFKHRRLVFSPSSPSKRTLRGDTRIISAVDELGWFPFGEDSNDLERAGAEEVWEALEASLLTVRNAATRRRSEGYDNIPTGYALAASSPQAYNDKIMSLVRTFKNSRYALAANFATWEMNPAVGRDDPAIIQAYLDNPIKAERNFGANPPMSDSAFIEDPSEFRECFTKKINIIGSYKYTQVDRSGSIMDSAKVHRRSAKFMRQPQFNGPTILSIDAGSTNNSFSLTLSKWLGKRPAVVGMMEVAPSPLKPLDHSSIYANVIKPIIENCQVALVFVDRWQSLKLIQDIEADSKAANKGYTVEGIEYSMKLDDFAFVLDWMKDKDHTPIFPKLEMDWESVLSNSAEGYPHCFKYQPISHFLFQVATVRENRRTVDKGHGYTDDLFRSCMLGLKHLYEEDTQEKLTEYAKLMTGSQSRQAIGAMATRSSGGAGRGAGRSDTTSNIGGVKSMSSGSIGKTRR